MSIFNDCFSSKEKMTEVKPGHFSIKEYHFHVYWFNNNEEASELQNRFIVITRDMLSLYFCFKGNMGNTHLIEFHLTESVDRKFLII